MGLGFIDVWFDDFEWLGFREAKVKERDPLRTFLWVFLKLVDFFFIDFGQIYAENCYVSDTK